MSKTKYSGVEWIGDIPIDWKVNRLRYNCTFKTGGTPPDKYGINTNADGYPWITAQDMNNGMIIKNYSQYINEESRKYCSYKLFPKDTILLVCIASVGKIGYLLEPAYSNQQITALMPNKNIFAKYLLYLIASNSPTIIKDASSNVVPIINTQYLANIYCCLPNINEQKLIANFLEEKTTNLDNILFDLNKQIEILTSYKKSIITETVTKGLNKNIKLKDSGVEWIGNIPKHWKITKNKYQIKIHNGKEIIEEMGEIPVYGTGGCFKNTNDYLYNGESVLLGRKGTIDNPMYVKGKFWTVDTCYYTTSYGKLMLKLFYYFSMCFDYKYYQTGSTLPSMTQYDLGSICVPDIPMNEQKEIVDYLDKKCSQIDKIIEEKEKQIVKIEEYKKSVIYEYVTGKKRVEGVEELYG